MFILNLENFEFLYKEMLFILENPNNFYCQTSILGNGIALTVLFSIICYFLSKLTDNYSWVDRFWSIIPGLHCANFFFNEYYCNYRIHQRFLLMCFLIWTWGIRLTYNYYRKGGYKRGSEDYRWEYIRNYLNNWIIFELLNLIFIAFIQNFLFLFFVSPLILSNQSDFNRIDMILTVFFFFFLILESVSDNQQWYFQKEKLRLKTMGKTLTGDYKRGFITTGLFKFSRHPNFFAEMCMWWTIYFFSINSTGKILNLSIIGPISYTLLFNMSTPLTEYISCGKYPEYTIYQKTTPKFIPWFKAGIKFD